MSVRVAVVVPDRSTAAAKDLLIGAGSSPDRTLAIWGTDAVNEHLSAVVMAPPGAVLPAESIRRLHHQVVIDGVSHEMLTPVQLSADEKEGLALWSVLSGDNGVVDLIAKDRETFFGREVLSIDVRREAPESVVAQQEFDAVVRGIGKQEWRDAKAALVRLQRDHPKFAAKHEVPVRKFHRDIALGIERIDLWEKLNKHKKPPKMIIDVRPDSPTYCQHFGVELTAENRRMLYVPKGFAHSFITLEDDTESFYFVDEFYAPELERGIRWDDPKFAIEWPLEPTVISEKDQGRPDFDPAYHLTS